MQSTNKSSLGGCPGTYTQLCGFIGNSAAANQLDSAKHFDQVEDMVQLLLQVKFDSSISLNSKRNRSSGRVLIFKPLSL